MATKRGCVLLLFLFTSLAALALAADELSDPTRPADRVRSNASAEVEAVPRNWILESTLVAPGRRVAVINGELVSEGESVDGARVIEIRRLDVLIQVPGRRIALQLLPDAIRTNP